MKQRLISVLILLLVASAFVFASGDQEKAAKAADTSKFVTVSHLSLGPEPASGQYKVVKAEWDKYLKEKLNCALEVQYLGWTDWLTKYNLTLATGEGLDMINTASDWLEMWPNAQKGAFMEIDALLPQYAPITWSTVPKESWAEVTLKGKIIAIPEDMYTQWINHGFMYRGDWAKEFGISKVNNWDDFGKYLQAAKDKKSKDGVIPFDIAGASNIRALYDGWTASYSGLICIDPVPNGLAYGKSDKEWWEVRSRYDVQDNGQDLLLDFAKKMKQWGDAGYWRDDVLNNTADSYQNFRAGMNATYQHHTQSYVGRYKDIERDIPGANMQWSPWGRENKNIVRMSITHGATAIGAKSANPERALMVYDLIRNDEKMYKLFNWGIEGVQYVINAKGQRDRPAGYTVDKAEFASNFWGGRMDKFELKFPNATMWDNWKTLYDEYDTYATPYRYGRFVFDRAPVESEIAAVGEVLSRLMPAICVGKAGDPVKAVTELRSQMKMAGNDKIIAEVKKQMAAFKSSVQ